MRCAIACAAPLFENNTAPTALLENFMPLNVSRCDPFFATNLNNPDGFFLRTRRFFFVATVFLPRRCFAQYFFNAGGMTPFFAFAMIYLRLPNNEGNTKIAANPNPPNNSMFFMLDVMPTFTVGDNP